MNNRGKNKILSLIMTAAMVLTMLPGVTAYAVDSGEPPLGASGVITAFDELDEYIQWQGFDFGEITAQDEITLPDALTAADAEGNPIVIDGVTWQSEPDFNPAVSAFYAFSPVLPEGYVLADGVTPPVISVFIRPQGGVGIMPLAGTVNNVTYLDENGDPATCLSAESLDDTMTTLTNGWYVVDSDVSFTSTLTVTGDVHLILENNCHLTMTGTSGHAGIEVTGTANLTIYAQSTGDDMGELTATGGDSGAGIGGGYGGSGGTVTINGGGVTANGGQRSAGIGGGYGGSGGTVTINGGSVTATGAGYSGGAGIGGGYLGGGGIITVNGGSVTANGSGSGGEGSGGAGIGGGSGGDGGTVTINGSCVVTATGGSSGAGIGGGYQGDGGSIDIGGECSVTATGGSLGAGIGGGSYGEGGVITIGGSCVVTATGGNHSAGIGGGGSESTFIGGGGGIITITGGSVTAAGTNGGAGIGGGGGPADGGGGGAGGAVTISGTNTVVTAAGANDIGSGADGTDGGSLAVFGGTVYLNANGTNAVHPDFKNCTIDGPGAVNQGIAGTYDGYGNRVIPYKVEYYLENASGSFGLQETVNKTGTESAEVTADSKTYTGYTEARVPETVNPAPIAGDGSTVLKVYYVITPAVTSITPSGTGAALDGDIVITFNKVMGTNTAGTVSLNNAALTEPGEWSNSDKTYTIPYSSLVYSAGYTVKVEGFQEAMAGVQIVADMAHSFTTIEAPAQAVTLLSATANGASGTTTSTKIDLVFDVPITGLTAGDIAITNETGSATKGALTGSGTNWSIAISGITQGTVSVAVTAPAGYTISGSPKIVNVYAASGGNGNGSSSSGDSDTTPVNTYGSVTINGVSVSYSIQNSTGVMSFTLTSSLLDKMLAAAGDSKTIAINLGSPTGLKGLDISFPPSWFGAHTDITFSVQSGIGGVCLNNNAARNFPAQNTTATVSLGKGSIKLSAWQSSKAVTWNTANAPVVIYMPYTPAADTDTNAIVLYDKATGAVVAHSFYSGGKVYGAVSKTAEYDAKVNAVSYTDTTSHWAKDDIAFVSVRGLISGATATAFSPNTAITRADFLMAPGKLSGADVSGYTTSSFTDVPNTNPAMPYIEWAVKNGIVEGIGDNQFGPDRQITREQMAVMMVNYAKATGHTLPVTRQTVTFADDAKINSWAKDAVKAVQRAGIMVGKSNNLFDPQGNATRAEASAILRRFTESVVNGGTGWVQNENGQWQYIQSDYTPKTGWLTTTEGNKYWFDEKGFRVSGKWVQIDSKWYYFGSDGKLAVNTTIDGYEVGADGARK